MRSTQLFYVRPDRQVKLTHRTRTEFDHARIANFSLAVSGPLLWGAKDRCSEFVSVAAEDDDIGYVPKDVVDDLTFVCISSPCIFVSVDWGDE